MPKLDKNMLKYKIREIGTFDINKIYIDCP